MTASSREIGSHIRSGGLMRCCLATIDQYEGPVEIGTVLPCEHCKDSMVIALDGVWEWNRPDLRK